MSFAPIKSWDNRRTAVKANCVNGRIWTRRIRQLEDSEESMNSRRS